MYQVGTPEHEAFLLGYKQAKDHHWEGAPLREAPEHFSPEQKVAFQQGWAQASDDM